MNIESYHFGEIVIDGHAYHKDLIIFPERVRPKWRRLAGHSLNVDDLQEVLSTPPQVLIIGTGAYGRVEVPQQTRSHLEAAGIQVIILKTKEACEHYNQMQGEQKVVAALHLTC